MQEIDSTLSSGATTPFVPAEALEEAQMRQRILDDPQSILGDPALMDALLRAEKSVQGRNVVDLRGVMLDRMENRIGHLETMRRDVMAAAYENISGTRQVHRAVRAIVGAPNFEALLEVLAEDVADILAVDGLYLCVEGGAMMGGADPTGVLVSLNPGEIAAYCRMRGGAQVALRQLKRAPERIYGGLAPEIRSEAVISLAPALPVMLVMGSVEAGRFMPDQGTDLLEFFGDVTAATLTRFF